MSSSLRAELMCDGSNVLRLGHAAYQWSPTRCAARLVSRPGGTVNGQLQAVPLRVKVVGLVSLPFQVPWNPNCTLPPGAIVGL